ncbi:MAG: hypothetical protein HKN52_10250 [Eudoraea sp.]|nr:hypothetical protein [Eudoraea sp.]
MDSKKISFYMLALATGLLFILSSCQRESTTIDSNEDQQYFVFNSTDRSFKAYDIATISQINGIPVASQRGPNKSTNGHVSTQSGLSFSFSALENPSGVHGQTQTNSGWPGVIESMHATSECITVIGDRAYFGGVITQIETGPYQPFSVGWQVYFAVEDNGQGNNADPDRYGVAIFFLPPGLLVTDVLPIEIIELYGIESWCDVWPIEYDDGGIPFDDGEVPTNIRIK